MEHCSNRKWQPVWPAGGCISGILSPAADEVENDPHSAELEHPHANGISASL